VKGETEKGFTFPARHNQMAATMCGERGFYERVADFHNFPANERVDKVSGGDLLRLCSRFGRSAATAPCGIGQSLRPRLRTC
jgi:hypothetical protein